MKYVLFDAIVKNNPILANQKCGAALNFLGFCTGGRSAAVLKVLVHVLVHVQGWPPILECLVRRTIYCVGKFRPIYFKNCVVVDVYSRVHSRISKFCMVAGLSAIVFFYLTDFDLLIGIIHIVSVQQKFEKICRTAIESRSESWGSRPQICLPEGQRTSM